MENPTFNRPPEIKFAGSGSEDQQDDVRDRYNFNFLHNRDLLTTESRKQLAAHEHKKTDYEKAAIADINHALNIILQRLGVEPFNIPEESIYILPSAEVKKIRPDEPLAFVNDIEKVIIMNADKLTHPRLRVSAFLHEMIHLKGFFSVEVSESGEDRIRRSGLHAYSTITHTEKMEGRGFRHFVGLDEAVVAKLEQNLLPRIIASNPLATLQITSIEKRHMRDIASELKLPEKEIMGVTTTQMGEQTKVEWTGYAYYEERVVLDYIIDTIFDNNPGSFPTKEAVFDLFLKAHFEGSLLPIARYIKSSFGEEAFRMIAMMSPDDKDSARKVLRYLKKHIQKSPLSQ